MQTEIHIHYLTEPNFCICEWYAKELCKHFGYSKKFTFLYLMGTPYEQNAELVLKSGITTLYPSEDPLVNDEL